MQTPKTDRIASLVTANLCSGVKDRNIFCTQLDRESSTSISRRLVGQSPTFRFSLRFNGHSGGCGLGGDELARRAHLQPGVRVVGVVVLEPRREQLEGSGGVRQRRDLDVVALQRADELRRRGGPDRRPDAAHQDGAPEGGRRRGALCSAGGGADRGERQGQVNPWPGCFLPRSSVANFSRRRTNTSSTSSTTGATG